MPGLCPFVTAWTTSCGQRQDTGLHRQVSYRQLGNSRPIRQPTYWLLGMSFTKLRCHRGVVHACLVVTGPCCSFVLAISEGHS